MTPPYSVLLVGASGFTGAWIRRGMLAAGWRVIGITRRPFASGDVGAGRGEFVSVLADAANLGECAKWLDQADAVVFNAAYIPRDHADLAEARACLEFNSFVPLAYLNRMIARARPFIYISGAQGYQVLGRLATEADPLFPTAHAAPYLGSKLMGDLFTEHFRVMHNLPTCVLRIGSIYGSGQERGMVVNFCRQAMARQRLVLQNGGLYAVDLTFVGDVVTAVLAALERGVTGLVNIGSGESTSALLAARYIVSALGAPSELICVEPAYPGRPSGGFAALDVSRARRELGFVPTSPEVGLTLTAHAIQQQANAR